jgi:ribonuclease-3
MREQLEEYLGYRFKDPRFLDEALTHPSVLRTGANVVSNQRLEFLGDGVLSLILGELVFHLYPKEREGKLSGARAVLVKGPFLARLAKQMKLGEFLRIDPQQAYLKSRDVTSALEDALEAIVGAIFLDSNYDTVRDVVLKWYGDVKDVLEHSMPNVNPKGQLQEYFQGKYQKNPTEYVVIATEGPDHMKHFVVEVQLDGEVLGTGSGLSKKFAEEEAARVVLQKIKDRVINI